MQLIAEFDRVVEQQNASFLAAKLHWLELVPRILEAAKSEGNESIAHWLHQRSEASDEGLFKRLCTDIHALSHCSGTTKLLASIFHALWSCNGVRFIDLLSEFAVNMHISTSNIHMNNVTLSVLSIFTGADCLLAAIILAYILHDPRTKKDHSRIVRIVTVSLLSYSKAFDTLNPGSHIHYYVTLGNCS